MIWFYNLKRFSAVDWDFKKKKKNFGPHLTACGILAPQPGIEPTLPELEGRVLATGPLGKSLIGPFLDENVTVA